MGGVDQESRSDVTGVLSVMSAIGQQAADGEANRRSAPGPGGGVHHGRPRPKPRTVRGRTVEDPAGSSVPRPGGPQDSVVMPARTSTSIDLLPVRLDPAACRANLTN
jgi:hypothetical protein